MTYALIIVGVWIGYVLLNIVLAEWNDALRRKNITIHHGWWGLMYAAFVAIPFLFFKDWYLVGSLALLHLSVFPVAYNHFAGLPAFFLSKTTTALADRFMVWLGFKSTEAVNLLSLAASIFLLIKSLQ